MDARAHKRSACAALAAHVSSVLVGLTHGGAPVPGATSSDRARAIEAYQELQEEMERRGSVVHRAPEPSAERPALPFPDVIERVEPQAG